MNIPTNLRAVREQIREINSVEDIIQPIESLFVNIGLLAMFLMMVLVTANAVGRYALRMPIPGVYELTEMFLMVMVIFLVTASLQEKNGNIDVDIVSRRFSQPTNTSIQFVTRIATVAIFGFITLLAFERAWEAYVRNWWTVGVISFPEYLSWLLMAIGLGLFCVRMVLQIKDDALELVEYI